MTQTLQLGGLVFEVRRSDRRKNLGLTVDRAGELVAHVPTATSADELMSSLMNSFTCAKGTTVRLSGPLSNAPCLIGRHARSR